MGRKHKNNKINDIGAAALAAVFVLGLNYAKVWPKATHSPIRNPNHVLHTDITEYKLTTGKKVYISPVIDEASLEILTCQASYSPNMNLVYDMLAELNQSCI